MSERTHEFERCMQAIYLAADSEVAHDIVRSVRSEVARLVAVRDELVEALRDCARVIEHDLESPRVAMPELRQARSALAKAKGGGA